MRRFHFVFILILGALICIFFFYPKKKQIVRVYQVLAPTMEYPEDNAFNAEKAELGRKLFFDRHLSVSDRISCASCHKPGLAFTDGMVKGKGVFGRESARNTPTIINTGYYKRLMYDGGVANLEMQALVPILEHSEMGMTMPELIEKLRKIPEYSKKARELFNREFDPYVLTRSLAAYERTLISFNSPFDTFYYQKKENFTDSEKRGFELFKDLKCMKCHSLPLFSNGKLENNGLYTHYADPGKFLVTGDSSDIGFFKVPGLRNVAVTKPYMHDGSLKTLEDVLDFYAASSKGNKGKSRHLKPFSLSKQQKSDLIIFLESLTDESFLIP